jgi:hypothetical protein
MNTYEFHGSIRIEANTDNEAINILRDIEAKMNCDIHINDWEEVK